MTPCQICFGQDKIMNNPSPSLPLDIIEYLNLIYFPDRKKNICGVYKIILGKVEVTLQNIYVREISLR